MELVQLFGFIDIVDMNILVFVVIVDVDDLLNGEGYLIRSGVSFLLFGCLYVYYIMMQREQVRNKVY